MNKFMQFMERKFILVAGKLANQRHLVAIRDAFMVSMPFVSVATKQAIAKEQ